MTDHFQLAEEFFERSEFEKACEEYEQAVVLQSDHVEAYIGWGRALNGLTKYEEAISKYQKAIELNPDYSEAYYLWGNSLFNLKQYEEAITKYQKATELKPDYSEAYGSWGIALLLLNQYEEAITQYQKVIELNPNYSEAYYLWGSTLDTLKKYKEAITQYQKVIELNPNYSEAYGSWGNSLFNLKQYEEAITKYQKATELKPDYSEAYHRWGNALFYLNEYEEAITKYQKAIELNPDYSEAYYSWGNALENIDQSEEAITKYNQAQKIDSNYIFSSLSSYKIAFVYWKQGAYKEARKKWNASAEIYERLQSRAEQDKNAYHFFFYGIILEVLNNLEGAEKQYKKGLKIDPNNISILTQLVNFYLNKKEQELDDKFPSRWVKARKYYIKARNLLKDELNKLEDTTTLVSLAKLYLNMDEYQEAEHYLLKALEKDSDIADIYTSLGTLSVSKESFREASDYFKKALKIAPYNFDIWSKLAEAYLKLKQLSQAESEYRKILSIAPCHVESHIGLGEVYIEMGDEGESDLYSQAIKHFDKAIKISKEREGSKILNKKELSGIYYLRGYARVKIYENPVGIKDASLLLEAQGDFVKCIDKDPENYKGITAHKKLEKQMEIQTIQSFTTVFGSGIIWFSSILILGITNLVFWQPFLSNNQDNKVSDSQSSLQSTTISNSSPNSKDSTQSSKNITVNKTSEPNRVNTTEYFLLTFGSLTFSLISLYLPQLLKLKIGGTGIEIEKSSIDQIKTSQIPTSLGIKK